MQYVEIKIAQIGHRSSYAVLERINGSDWQILDYGISIESADEFADELHWAAQEAGHKARTFYEWTSGQICTRA